MTYARLLLSCAAITALAGCGQNKSHDSAETPADTVATSWCFSGGPIYTSIDAAPTAEALAVKEGLITYTAANAPEENWCETHAGAGAQNVNLGGKALYSGLTDSHGHLLGIGLREMTINLEGTLSVTEMQDRLKTPASETPKGETIFGRGWIETHWPEKRFPNRQDLDSVTADHAIILTRADGHAAVVNSAALKAAGITRDTKAPFGGDILKDENGEPTGMLIDNAINLVNSLIPILTEERKKEAYIKASEVYSSRGWANIHAMSVNMDNLPLMMELSRSGDIGLRVYNSPDIKNADALTRLQAVDTSNSDHITVRAIKLYSDGALGSRGAALLAPYSDDPKNTGLLLITKERIMPILERSLRDGIQVNTHAIGDKANQLLLDWYEEAFQSVPASERAIADPRWRVEHAQILTLPDLKRFQALGIIPSMQPSHAIGDLHFANDRLGPERLKGGYAWRSLIDSGSIIAGGSDAPVEIGDPRIEFYAAVTRKDLKGFSGKYWYPEEKVTRQEALKMFTIWPAYASFQEDKTGSIEVGKAADFTVFETDIMTAKPEDILTAKVAMTIVDGKLIYSANDK
ncbi:MAG: amidohydrolase [Alphaproteobacteria bacterium]